MVRRSKARLDSRVYLIVAPCRLLWAASLVGGWVAAGLPHFDEGEGEINTALVNNKMVAASYDTARRSAFIQVCFVPVWRHLHDHGLLH